MQLMDQIITDLSQALIHETTEREKIGGLKLPKPTIRVMGQMSLLMDPEASKLLPLALTFDLDALIVVARDSGHIRTLLKEVLNKYNVVYDDLSSEIWIAADATFIKHYDTEVLCIERLDPISALTAKAIKAPSKNRELVAYAIETYGKALSKNILLNGGSLEQFKKGHPQKL